MASTDLNETTVEIILAAGGALVAAAAAVVTRLAARRGAGDDERAREWERQQLEERERQQEREQEAREHFEAERRRADRAEAALELARLLDRMKNEIIAETRVVLEALRTSMQPQITDLKRDAQAVQRRVQMLETSVKAIGDRQNRPLKKPGQGS